jgi:hypothetical protein
MTILHTHPRAGNSSTNGRFVKPYGEPTKSKPSRSQMVRKLVKPRAAEITPVFVGIAG